MLHFANPFVKVLKSLQNTDYYQINWDYLLEKGEENKVLVPLVQNLLAIDNKIPEEVAGKLQVVLDEGERIFQQWIQILNSTIVAFREKPNHIDVLLIKSLKGYPHSRMDLDFLFRNQESLRKAMNILKRTGYVIYTADDKHKLCCVNDREASLFEIDLHSEVTWRNVNLTFFDYEEIWKRRVTTRSYGIEIPTPSVEDDMLITCAHSIFGHHHYFLGDLFYLASVLKKEIDFQYAFGTAKKFGWSLALYYFLLYSDMIYQLYYNKTMIRRGILESFVGENAASRLIDEFLPRQNEVPKFPNEYPIAFEFLVFIEKTVSNLNKQNIRRTSKESTLFVIDTVHALMSRVYRIFTQTLVQRCQRGCRQKGI